MNVKGKNITVIGMGRSGISAANFLAKQEALVTVTDQQVQEQLARALTRLSPAVRTRFGDPSPPPESDYIILSPGVDIDSPFLTTAKQRGIPILSEIELASRFTSVPIIAVTGTNGKSTCVSLIGDMLSQAGFKAPVGGNIGIPFISLVEKNSLDFIVLEVSSFQLEAIQTFRPYISILLNVTPDHLDRHKTLDRYLELKEKITLNQTEKDFLVLNREDPRAMSLVDTTRAKTVFFSTQSSVEKGAFIKDEAIFFRFGKHEERVCQLADLHQSMQWQLETLLAAVTSVGLLRLSSKSISETLRSFHGLEHRMEWVRTYKGIDFINDSKGTNVGAVKKSLATLHRPVVLIAGGKDKGSDFHPLKDLIRSKVKHLILIGESRKRFREILNGSYSWEEAESMEGAVRQAVSKAVCGDIVLLSPACASFDMFQNFEERGNCFKRIVNELS